MQYVIESTLSGQTYKGSVHDSLEPDCTRDDAMSVVIECAQQAQNEVCNCLTIRVAGRLDVRCMYSANTDSQVQLVHDA